MYSCWLRVTECCFIVNGVWSSISGHLLAVYPHLCWRRTRGPRPSSRRLQVLWPRRWRAITLLLNTSIHISSYVLISIYIETSLIRIQVSKLSKVRRPSALIPLPSPYVRSVLAKVGLACGAGFSGRPATSTPYWSHALLDYTMTLLGLPEAYIRHMHGQNKDVRRRALRKLEREGKKNWDFWIIYLVYCIESIDGCLLAMRLQRVEEPRMTESQRAHRLCSTAISSSSDS